MQVVVRLRPLAAHEEGASAVEIAGGEVLLREPVAASDYLASLRCKERRWAYDAAFGPRTAQAEVYSAPCAPRFADVAEGGGQP